MFKPTIIVNDFEYTNVDEFIRIDYEKLEEMGITKFKVEFEIDENGEKVTTFTITHKYN